MLKDIKLMLEKMQGQEIEQLIKLARKEQGRILEDKGIDGTVEDFLKYLADEGKTKSTIDNYESDLSKFAEYMKKKRSITEISKITEKHIGAFLKANRKSVTRRTLSRWLISIRALYVYLEKYGVENITKNIEVPEGKVSVKKELMTMEELQRFINEQPVLRNKLITMLLAKGLRRTEVVNLKILDVDFGGLKILIKSNEGRDRYVTLTEIEKDLIQEYLDSRNRQSEFLFVTKQSDFLNVRAVERAVQIPAEKMEWLKGKTTTPLGIRQTITLQLLEENKSPEEVADILGYKDYRNMDYFEKNFTKKSDD